MMRFPSWTVLTMGVTSALAGPADRLPEERQPVLIEHLHPKAARVARPRILYSKGWTGRSLFPEPRSSCSASTWITGTISAGRTPTPRPRLAHDSNSTRGGFELRVPTHRKWSWMGGANLSAAMHGPPSQQSARPPSIRRPQSAFPKTGDWLLS